MKKIGLLGGTFNPIHFGHIHLALSLKEAKGLDTVFFSPNYYSAFAKDLDPFVTPEHRLKMVELALEPIEGLETLSQECQKPGVSYTIDLVRSLKQQKRFEACELYLLLGQDLLERFHLWKEAPSLLQETYPIIGSRTFETKAMYPEFVQKAFEEGYVPIDRIDISSSKVRYRLEKNLYCGHLVPQSVLNYIHKNKIYI